MSTQPKTRLTPEEYLAFERASETKHEFFAGEIFAMAGASREHNLITVNIAAELRAQLKGHPCEAYAGDMRVRVADTGLYTYPDVVVVCGEPQFDDALLDTLLNPTLIVEVLSPSTEAYDRGDKFAFYRELESLREYVLVSQHRPRVERFIRREGGWILGEARGIEATVALETIGCELRLSEIYDRVAFPRNGGARFAPHG